MSHLFISPPQFALMQSGAMDTPSQKTERSQHYLTEEDVHAMHCVAAADPPFSKTSAALGRQKCEIPRIDTKLPLGEFLRQYQETPAIISASTGTCRRCRLMTAG
jgi:hypothetical protein